MQGDAVHILDELKWEERVQALAKGAIQLQTLKVEAERNLSKTQEEIERLSDSVEKLTKAGELLRVLMDKLVLDQVQAIEKVVTEGLRAIYTDQALNFEASVGTFRNKVAIDLMIRREQNGIEIVGPLLETTGGGISSVASLTLRLLTLMRLSRFPLLILDETLSAVSDDYIDATGQFLAKLSETSKIPILLVTHKQSFLDHANRAYQGVEDTSSDDFWCMRLKRIR